MPIDHCKMSIEARPLRVLFSKYSPTDTSGPLHLVRPLGRVRKGRRPSFENLSQQLPTVVAGGQHAYPESYSSPSVERLCTSETEMNKSQETLKSKWDKTASFGRDSVENIKGKDYQLPAVSRSKAQAFEHQYKIAASRGGALKEHLPSKLSRREPSKKVIHLPLFQINLRTFNGESEDSRTVESTRESLRQMMELHKARMKPANVMTANIQNYEFSAPIAGSQSTRNCDSKVAGGILLPFPAKSILKSPKQMSDQRHSVVHKQYETLKISEPKATRFYETSSSSVSDPNETGEVKQNLSDDFDLGADDEADDSLLSIAIRPDTALTLGSTIHQIDRVIRSPGSDELRELSEAFRNSDTQPAWPSYDDIQKMRMHALSRRSKNLSRNSATVSGNMTANGYEHHSLSNQFANQHFGERIHSRNLAHDHFGQRSAQTPMLRYTTKQSAYKLEPIIVPSHTCTECPMCNIYQRELEATPCPPNSPTGTPRLFNTQPSQQKIIINSEEESGTKPNSGSKRNPKPEVLHVSRIMVNGDLDPAVKDDHSVLSYMKANG